MIANELNTNFVNFYLKEFVVEFPFEMKGERRSGCNSKNLFVIVINVFLI